MAVELTEKVTFSGDSKVNDTIVERYNASIDKANPESMTLTRVIIKSQLRKDNREQCRADMAQFEDDVYAAQDQMLAEYADKENLSAMEEAVEEIEDMIEEEDED